MANYKKIFLDFYKASEYDTFICIIPDCGKIAVDIHHVDQKKMGGHAGKDRVENLAQVCRHCHDLADAYKIEKEYLFDLIRQQMINGLK